MRKLLLFFGLLAGSSLVLALGCRGKDKEAGEGAADAGFTTPTSAPITANAKAEADDIFASRCTPCHGPAGEGNGPASNGLTPKPRNFHDPSWQAGVDDSSLEKIIQYGGAAVGKSPAMPANPDLVGKPQVVAALRDRIRSFKP